MGVLNVTPDSFSDGGAHADAQSAVDHGLRMDAEGARLIDVGGESTRPGALPVSAAQELERVVPVVAGLAARTGALISIDTSKLEVAEAALDAGAAVVNDVTAMRHAPELAGLVADRGAHCVLMHMLGEPRTMQQAPRYTDVVDEVRAFLEERLAFAVGAGVPEDHVLLDPGIGFGKTTAHNLELLRRLGELAAIGRPLVVGTSRKAFLGRIPQEAVGGPERSPRQRLPGTIATCVMALERGASILRVHDVAAVGDALLVAAATLTGRWTPASIPRTPTT